MSVSIDDNLSRCVCCDELREDQLLVTIGDGIWCQGCLADDPPRCQKCGQLWDDKLSGICYDFSGILGVAEPMGEHEWAVNTGEAVPTGRTSEGIPAVAAASEPLCHWYGGDCDQPADPELDGLCPFHFDACERPQHADAQAKHDALTPAICFTSQPVSAGNIRELNQ